MFKNLLNTRSYIKRQLSLSNLENQTLFKDELNKIYSKIRLESKYLETIMSASHYHKEIFPKYKNINQGKDIVLIATGPTLEKFKPIENAIYVAVNKAFEYDKVKFDYIFIQDYANDTKSYVDKLMEYPAKKFIGIIPDYIYENCNICIFPNKYFDYKDVERYYIAHPTLNKGFTADIATLPFGDFYSIVFPAMQFILWTNPKRIYLVGCDCSLGGYYNSNKKNELEVNKIIEGWEKMKKFISVYYPDTEVISINPVGLKGVFKDIYEEK